MFTAWLVLASSVSIEEVAIKMLTNTGSTGIAIFLAYILYKVLMARKDRKLDKIANAPDDRDSGRAMLGGSNPAGTEISGVVLSPEKQPVAESTCGERMHAQSERFGDKIDAVGKDVQGMRSDLADTNRSINKALLKMTEQVNATNTCVAVLKDRANRDR